MLKNINYKKFIYDVIIALLVFVLVSSLVSYFRKPNIDVQLPSISAKTIGSKNIDFNEYLGKPLMIHFWGSWCPVCKAELSNIDSIAKNYQVVTIAVNSGDDKQIKDFMHNRDISFDIINDSDGTLAQQYNISVFPTTLIYGSDGKLHFSEVGYTSTLGLRARMAWAGR